MTDEMDIKLKTGLMELMRESGVPEHAMLECGCTIITAMARWSANRTIRDFSHQYGIFIRRLEPEEGGGYMACIPQLGTACFHGMGESPEEALNDLEGLYAELRVLWADDPDMKWDEPKTEDNIQWNDKTRPSADETHERFKELLNEVNRKEILNDQAGS